MVDEIIRIYQNKILELEAKRDEIDSDIVTLQQLIKSFEKDAN